MNVRWLAWIAVASMLVDAHGLLLSTPFLVVLGWAFLASDDA